MLGQQSKLSQLSVMAVADKEASATSLNRQSWGFEEDEVQQQRSSVTTPLLRRQKAPHSSRGKGQRDLQDHGGGETQTAYGRETSASYSALMGSEEKRHNLFVTRTVFGEVSIVLIVFSAKCL